MRRCPRRPRAASSARAARPPRSSLRPRSRPSRSSSRSFVTMAPRSARTRLSTSGGRDWSAPPDPPQSRSARACPTSPRSIAKAFGLPETAAVAGLGCAVIVDRRPGRERRAARRWGARRRHALRADPHRPVRDVSRGGTPLERRVRRAVRARARVPARRTPVGSALAVESVGAAGLAHPEFLWLAVAISASQPRWQSPPAAGARRRPPRWSVSRAPASRWSAWSPPRPGAWPSTSRRRWMCSCSRRTSSTACTSSSGNGSCRRSPGTRSGHGCHSPPWRSAGCAAGSDGCSQRGLSSPSQAWSQASCGSVPPAPDRRVRVLPAAARRDRTRA